MSATLIFGPRSRRRIYSVRSLKVDQGVLDRGPFIGLYQATSGEAAVRAARRDFARYRGDVLAAVDQVAGLQVMGGETAVYTATIQCPDGTCRNALLTRDVPIVELFRRIRIECDPKSGAPLHFANPEEIE